jgi:Zn-dependent M16 (insulinase) family peptidase
MTYPDRTVYPVASQNLQDFYNLTNVYLDAVFFPKAVNEPRILAQEGWHYDIDAPDDPLTFKGVVFNEMKGVYSSPDSLLYREIQQTLFPNNTYGVDSGGDPRAITELTFEEFRDFHATYYHPSNAQIFFYGDDPEGERLSLLDEYLREFSPLHSARERSEVKVQKRWAQPRDVVAYYPSNKAAEGGPGSDAGGGEISTTVNWVLNEVHMSPREQLAWDVLDHLLMGTSASILRKSLIDSGIGSSVVGGGMDDTLMQSTFSVGLKGVSSVEDCAKLESLVFRTLEKLAHEGFEPDAVESSLNTLEFQLREFNTGGSPKGLSFMLRSMSSWIYDQDPLSPLQFEAPLAALKADLEAGVPVFQTLIKDYLLDNTHRASVTLLPDTNMEAKLKDEEVSRLSQIKSNLSPADVDALVRQTQDLRDMQAAPDSEEDKAAIPRICLSDVDRKVKEIPIEVDATDPRWGGATVVTHPISTNGIVHVDVLLDLTATSLDDVSLLPLFQRMVMETGTSKRDRVAMSRRIGAKTGGVGCSVMLSRPPPDDGHTAVERYRVLNSDALDAFFTIKGKCTPTRVSDLLGIMTELLSDANLHDRQRAVEILKETVVRMKSQIIGSGHSFAASKIGSESSFAGLVSERMSGIAYFEAAQALLSEAEDDAAWEGLQQRLEGLRDGLLACPEGRIVNLTADAPLLDVVKQDHIAPFLNSLTAHAKGKGSAVAATAVLQRGQWGAGSSARPVFATSSGGNVAGAAGGLCIPTQVNYVGRGMQVYHEGEAVHGSAQVVSGFLRTGYLWENVRVIGGAYGGMCDFNRMSGNFLLLSYRDPNLAKTLQTYVPSLLLSFLPSFLPSFLLSSSFICSFLACPSFLFLPSFVPS